VPDKHFILDRHALTNEGVALDLAPFAYEGILLDLYKRADSCFVVNGATVQVDEVTEGDILAKFNGWGNDFGVHK
jgi:hypothetical protein